MEQQTTEAKTFAASFSTWFDKNYKLLLIIPVILMLISLTYLFMFFQSHGDIMYKDSSLAGGTTITLKGEMPSNFESELKSKFADLSTRKLTDLSSGKSLALIIESSSTPEELTPEIERILGYKLDETNSSTEFSGPSLSQNFYKQLLYALALSFILMSIVIFILFRSFIPSIAVIFSAFADIVMPLALLDYLGVKLSAAGIAAFLMLIGYSVDTDILLTSRALKKKEGTLNSRIYGAFKTGMFMTGTALAAVLPAFFLVTGLPDSFRQIFLILVLGQFADIINTWLTNVSIIKWYCDKKGIK